MDEMSENPQTVWYYQLSVQLKLLRCDDDFDSIV